MQSLAGLRSSRPPFKGDGRATQERCRGIAQQEDGRGASATSQEDGGSSFPLRVRHFTLQARELARPPSRENRATASRETGTSLRIEVRGGRIILPGAVAQSESWTQGHRHESRCIEHRDQVPNRFPERCHRLAVTVQLRGDPIYASGTLRTGYLDRVEADVEILDAVEHADLNRLRDLLTWIVRRDRFSAGVGDEAYWCGHLDAIFDGMGSHVGAVYPLPHTDASRPRRTPPCPTCGDTDTVDFDKSSSALLWGCAICQTTFDYPSAGAVEGRVPHT